MRYEISYTSEYRYDAPVIGSHNRLRMRPADEGTQRAERFDVRVEPAALTHTYRDLFGNEVVEILVAAPHEHLEIEVDTLVATTEPLPPPDASWAMIRTDAYRTVAGIYLHHPAPPPPALTELAAELRGEDPVQTALSIMSTVHERLRYDGTATGVNSTVADVLGIGAGVCQDFAHVAAGLLREHDIAARYVSGYFYTVPGDSDGAASAEVQTHAWVEALLPVSGDGAPVWVGLDPTNDQLVGANHVKIGHGRQYTDVPPIEGSFAGAANSTIESHVTMRPLAPSGETTEHRLPTPTG